MSAHARLHAYPHALTPPCSLLFTTEIGVCVVNVNNTTPEIPAPTSTEPSCLYASVRLGQGSVTYGRGAGGPVPCPGNAGPSLCVRPPRNKLHFHLACPAHLSFLRHAPPPTRVAGLYVQGVRAFLWHRLARRRALEGCGVMHASAALPCPAQATIPCLRCFNPR